MAVTVGPPDVLERAASRALHQRGVAGLDQICGALSPVNPDGGVETCGFDPGHETRHSWQGTDGISGDPAVLQRDDGSLGRSARAAQAKLRIPRDEEFVIEGADFLVAPELQALARQLIDRCTPEFGHLQPARLTVLWKRKGGGSQKPVLGKCQKPNGLLAYFSTMDFVIWLAADHARKYELGPREIEAVLYHELCHAGWEEDEDDDNDGKWIIRPHDVETFSAEIERYGLWKEDLREVGATIRQLRLDGLR